MLFLLLPLVIVTNYRLMNSLRAGIMYWLSYEIGSNLMAGMNSSGAFSQPQLRSPIRAADQADCSVSVLLSAIWG